MRPANHFLRASGARVIAFSLIVGSARSASAQVAPNAPLEPSAEAPSATAAPPDAPPEEPTLLAPGAPTAVAPNPDAGTQAPSAPSTATANAGPASAAFAPLPEPARERAIPKPAIHAPAPLAQSEPPGLQGPRAGSELKPDQARDADEWNGPLAPFRLGVLIGAGLPELLNFGAELKVTRYVGIGVSAGLIPTTHISYYGDATLAYQAYDAYVHVYPFGGSFFIGSGVGYAKIKGTLATQFTPNASEIAAAQQSGIALQDLSLSVESEATVRTMVLTPQLGFLQVFESGFAIGLDLGAQIPIAPSEVRFSTIAAQLPSGGTETDAQRQARAQLQTSIQTRYINPNDERVRSTLDKIGRTPLPTFSLKIGWFL